MSTIELKPQVVFDCFAEINAVPRPSKKEEKIIAYLLDFATKYNLAVKTDEVGNVLISKPATAGYENKKTVVLQSHMDMVCEKNNDVTFDFENDAIQTEIKEEWLHAKGTTLGADDGIGMAMALAILKSNDVAHGPIECLFTVDEETGLTGANALQGGFFDAEILINLDSEDEGQLYVSCAGGAGTQGIFTLSRRPVTFDAKELKLTVRGLTGGHSGDDINKNRANANKLLLRYLFEGITNFGVRLVDIQAGGLHNAIPREATAVLAVEKDKVDAYVAKINEITTAIAEEFAITEPHFTLDIAQKDFTLTDGNHILAYDEVGANQMIKALFALANGVFAMSEEMPGLVETSSNLASIRAKENEITVVTSQRSAINSARKNMSNVVRTGLELGGAKAITFDGYPGWKYNPNSEILKISVESYKRLFNKEPKVLAIHAGLECGLIGEKYPFLDMISLGPTLRGVHSPDERLHIPSVELVWIHLLDVLKHIPNK